MRSPDAGRGLTAPAFASLLARLGPDAEAAGAAYEHLRRALVSLFTWRGASTPEECADETLDRLARRLQEGERVDDVARYARGIARLVLLEHWRQAPPRTVPLESIDAVPTSPASPPDDTLAACLERCLAEMEAGARELILGYYVAEGRTRIERRKRLAAALGVSESALRNRAQRLRDRLEGCITRCAGPRGGRDTEQ
jgi:DNA-directed RNA polymerase specialized sigma24 family protein